MEYCTNTSARAFRARWFTENCCEFETPEGKHILIDPILLKDESAAPGMLRGYVSGYGIDDVDRCDLILLTHTHGDHTASLKEAWERFRCPVLCSPMTSYALARQMDIPYSFFINGTDGFDYNFGDFRVMPLPAVHSHITVRRPSADLPPAEDDAGRLANSLGSMYNQNYLITLSNGLRLAFDAGQPDDVLSEWEKYRPFALFRHRHTDFEEGVRILYEGAVRSRATFILPICKHKNPELVERQTEEVNRKLAESGSYARCVNMKPGKWVSFDTVTVSE